MSNVTTLSRYTAPVSRVGATERAHAVLDLLPQFVDLAGKIARTEFVPTGLRNRPEAVLAALLSGAERGLGPMEALRSISVIEGRPNLSAEAMRALVLAAGHEIFIDHVSPTRAVVRGRRAGSEITSEPFVWTIERARRARLANKDNWSRYPEAMLLARASTDLCRAVFPDVIAGLASTEEVTDEVAVEQQLPGRRSPARRSPVDAAPDTSAPVLAAAAPEVAAAEQPPAGTLDGIPGSDVPSWAPTGLHDPTLAKRIHAEIADAFPSLDAPTRDRFRHALVAVVTRKRGSVSSSSDLDLDEQLRLSKLLAEIRAGRSTVTDEPDDRIALRAGGWLYTITLDPIGVEVTRSSGADDGTREDSSSSAPVDDTGNEAP